MKAVIYCRISSWSQAKGDGLRRQLDCCMGFAADNGYDVAAVFSEVASGGGALPSRETAERVARGLGAKILVESPDRWSRGAGSYADPKRVEFCSREYRDFERRLGELLRSR